MPELLTESDDAEAAVPEFPDVRGNVAWGDFMFTRKNYGTPRYGLQMTCKSPEHGLCKKFKTCNIEGGEERVLTMLKWWVVLGLEAPNREAHRALWDNTVANAEELPTDDWLAAAYPASLGNRACKRRRA